MCPEPWTDHMICFVLIRTHQHGILAISGSIVLKSEAVSYDPEWGLTSQDNLVPRLFFFLLCLLEHEKQVAETRREREYLHACLRKRKAWCLIIADTAIN